MNYAPTQRRPIWALVPVKAFAAAKSRLAGVLSPAARDALQRAMLEDVLTALGRAHALSGIVVVTPDDEVARFARGFGALTVPETLSARDLNGALHDGVGALRAMGAARALVLPADIPLLEPSDVDAAVALARGTDAPVVVPNRHCDGTNGLVVALDRSFPFAFGANSYRRHLACVAQGKGLPARLPSFALDVDTPADLAALRASLNATAFDGAVRPEGLVRRIAARTAAWSAAWPPPWPAALTAAVEGPST